MFVLIANRDMGTEVVHALKFYNDDTGHGGTMCGLAVYPSDEGDAGPANCETCKSLTA